jgi:hypothetical protein
LEAHKLNISYCQLLNVGYEDYIKQDPLNNDLKRKGYTAVAAKIARVAYGIVKNETNYRCYHESVIPSGGIPSVQP